jgi:hypothetical protein
MAYKHSRRHQIIGDISGSDDSNRNTGINFEEDYIGLRTNGATRFKISGSSGAITFNEAFTFPTWWWRTRICYRTRRLNH